MLQWQQEITPHPRFPDGDYVSPGFALVKPDPHFPNLMIDDPNSCGWPYLRKTIRHNWYRDKRVPGVGFANRDEAHVLYNTALLFRSQAALEIGCFLGWSTCHLALGGVRLDTVDPLLANPDVMRSVRDSLSCCGVLDSVHLIAAPSPDAVKTLARNNHKAWSLVFIDGNHDFPAPVIDAVACEQFCAPDAMILFHDLMAPAVAEGLYFLRDRGWNARLFHTTQIMGVAWRGNVQPVAHHPDPAQVWSLPPHLDGWSDSEQ
jgi:predicted O-methyltransferase YrrM